MMTRASSLHHTTHAGQPDGGPEKNCMALDFSDWFTCGDASCRAAGFAENCGGTAMPICQLFL